MPTRLQLLTLFLAIAAGSSACSVGQAAPSIQLNADTPSAAATAAAPAIQEAVPVTPSLEATPTQVGSFDTAALMLDFSDATNKSTLRLVDTTNGAPVAGYEPLVFDALGSYGYVPGGRALAIVTYENAYSSGGGSLVLLDIPSWTTTSVPLTLGGWAQAMAFSRDGARVAIAGYGDGANLVIVDAAKGVAIAEASVPNQVRGLSFTQDGSGLMVYASNVDTKQGLTRGAPQALLLDATDLSVQWRAALPAVRDAFFPGPDYQGNSHSPGAGTRYLPGLAFSPVSDTLYLVHADEDRLTRVDFSARKVGALDIRPPLSFLEQLLSLGARVAHAKMQSGPEKHVAVSPDGSSLYVAGMDSRFTQKTNGEWDLHQEAFGLTVVEAATGSELLTLDTQADQVAVLGDGLVLLRTWGGELPSSEVYDPAAKKIVVHYAGMYQNCVPLMKGGYVLVPSILYVNRKYDMQVFEPASEKVLGSWEIENFNTQWVSCNP